MAIITLQFRFRLFFCITLGFILCTVIGTVSHESGHYIVGKYLGHDAKLHYASTSYNKSDKSKEYDVFIEKNKDKIQAQEKSPEKDKYSEIAELKRQESLFLVLGGPVLTILMGTIGFLILWFKRKKIYRKYNLSSSNWISIFLAFFWSRQVFNFIASADMLLQAEETFYKSDEPRISQLLNLPFWSIGLLTCIIGLLILSWICFKIIPIRQRLTFILAGLAGSAAGWCLWMYKLGPIILP